MLLDHSRSVLIEAQDLKQENDFGRTLFNRSKSCGTSVGNASNEPQQSYSVYLEVLSLPCLFQIRE